MRNKIFGIVTAGMFLLLAIMPMINSVTIENEIDYVGIPENPEIIIWHCNGITAKKETIKLNRDEAYQIKQELKGKTSTEERHKILAEHNVLSEKDLKITQKFSKKTDNYAKKNVDINVGGDLIAFVNAIFTGSTSSTLLGFLLFYFYVTIISSGPSEANVIGASGNYSVESETGLYLFLLFFMGLIIMIPFIDPNGGELIGFTWFLFIEPH